MNKFGIFNQNTENVFDTETTRATTNTCITSYKLESTSSLSHFENDN